MIVVDEESLICDLAETYRILNYRELPVQLLATLSVGLGPNSRIKMKLNKINQTTETILLSMIADYLRVALWQNSVDGSKNINFPSLICDSIFEKNKLKNISVFESAEDFEKAKNMILKGEVDING